MSIMDDYKQLQMIENIKRIKEMEICYKSNLKLCKQQEKQINKLATTIEKIKEIAEKQVKRAPDGETFARPEIKQILQKISECEVEWWVKVVDVATVNIKLVENIISN